MHLCGCRPIFDSGGDGCDGAGSGSSSNIVEVIVVIVEV